MAPRRLVTIAFAVLVGCGLEPTPEVEVRQSALESSAPEAAPSESAPKPQPLNGTSLYVKSPTLNGCELSTASGVPTPTGCSNNGPLVASTLASVSLLSITAPNGAPISSASIQGTRLVGSVNGAQVSGEAFVGALFNGTATDGSPVRLRLDGVTPGTKKQPNLWRYEFSYLNSKGDWKSLCKSNKKAVIVAGRWDYREGTPGDGAKTNDPTVFTVGCRRSAIEKCINAGYKPWEVAGDASLDLHHQACVRMMRADYCGDGVSHTSRGRKVNLYDPIGIEADTETWLKEAEWTAHGARCVSSLNLTAAHAPCLPLLGTKTCGEEAYRGAETLIVSETPKRGGRFGQWNEEDDD